MNPLLSLADQWRTDARLLLAYGDDRGAGVCDLHAAQVKQAWDAWQDEALTLDQSAQESGYTSDHLGKLVCAGSIPNAGRPNSPRIRRGHLPRKPGHMDAHCHTAPVDCREQIARSVADSSKGERDG
jgi:hypothetical protein